MTKRTKRLSVSFIALLVFAVVFSAPLAATYNDSHYLDHINDAGNSEAFRDAVIAAGFTTGHGYANIDSLAYVKHDHNHSGTTNGFVVVVHNSSGSGHATIDFTAPVGKVVYFVWVKQGDGGIIYGYKNGVASDSGLLSPGNAISHVSFWYGNAPTATPTFHPTATAHPTKDCHPSTTPTVVPPTPTEVPPTPTEVPPTPTEVPPTPTEVPPTPTEVPPTPTEVPPTPTEVPPTPTTEPTITIPEPTIPQTTITGYATITEPPIPTTGGADTNLLYLLGSALVAGGLMLKRRKNHN